MLPSLWLGNASSICLLEQLGPQRSNKPQRGCDLVMLYLCECKYYENQCHFTDNTNIFNWKKPQQTVFQTLLAPLFLSVLAITKMILKLLNTFSHAVHQGTVAVMLQIWFKPDLTIGQNTAWIKNSEDASEKDFPFFAPLLSPHLTGYFQASKYKRARPAL